MLCVSGISADSSATALLCCIYHSLPDNTLRSPIQFENKEEEKTCSSSGWLVWFPGFGLCFASECWAFP